MHFGSVLTHKGKIATEGRHYFQCGNLNVFELKSQHGEMNRTMKLDIRSTSLKHEAENKPQKTMTAPLS
jgi:hypothetical protein